MIIKDGDRVFIHGGQMVPEAVLGWIEGRYITAYSLHLEGGDSVLNSTTVYNNNLFVGHNARSTLANGTGSYIPMGLSAIPGAMRDGTLPIDVAIVQVSYPNTKGMYSLGLSCDVAYQAIRSAERVIYVVNRHVPRTYGHEVHLENAAAVVYDDRPLTAVAPRAIDFEQATIARHVAARIRNGSTIQLGIGAIASGLGTALGDHEDLYVHSEMIADSVVALVEKGVIHHITTSFAVGSTKLHKFVDRNPLVRFLPIDEINDFRNIASIPNFCAVNNVVEADLIGNTVCDSIGDTHISGIGGQHDFAHAALYSPGGKSFLCLKSTTSGGKSRIVNKLSAAATVPKHLADYIVTEHGAVRLKGLNLKERARAMIKIAHPSHREELRASTHDV